MVCGFKHLNVLKRGIGEHPAEACVCSCGSGLQTHPFRYLVTGNRPGAWVCFMWAVDDTQVMII